MSSNKLFSPAKPQIKSKEVAISWQFPAADRFQQPVFKLIQSVSQCSPHGGVGWEVSQAKLALSTGRRHAKTTRSKAFPS